MKTFYDLLGVQPNADGKEIRSAFRRLARECHPDLNECSDNQRFIDLKNAYDTLADDGLRRDYDRRLRQERFQPIIPFEQRRRQPGAWQERRYTAPDELDLANLLDQLVDDFLERDEMMPRGRAYSRRRSPIEDLHFRPRNDLWDLETEHLTHLIDDILDLFGQRGWFRW